MKLSSLQHFRLGFRIAIASVFALTVGALAFIYIQFSDYLVGDIKTDANSQILTKLDIRKFDEAETQRKARESLPYADPGLRNPFAAPKPPEPPPQP